MASLFRNSLRTAAASSFHAAPRVIARPAASSAFLRASLFAARPVSAQPRVAALHTSQPLRILPAGPLNDAVPVPEANPTNGSFHWSFERLVSIALIPLTVAPFAAGSVSPVTDAVFGAAVVIHSHLGFEAMIIDYIPERKNPTARKAFMWGLKGTTVLVLIGLYEFQTNDVGITEGVKRFWKA
ncbi:membrane anchor subunit of succinate dehydrogenase, Sdh4 [Maublancomyces gigas]|uniref:Succinate dehydrogenase [ubiquinone] cytochrome b small subunit n=1 Tax=Discina gigas TaxID=1032678 RepID=A0ABR3GM24_9PEZI